ncbi:PLDc N-terminal domain-containing protein [Myroides marinus]|uniref:PLDc N-terminal domain-containing protein n=1 Tax=Myroides marinus TaxID=703342 RepID=UPI0025781318|nr:PLDc N-terminal domain-containing protein [Myroides marinus]
MLIPYSLYKVGRADLEYNKKIIWCLLIIFVSVLGAIAYLLVGNSKKNKPAIISWLFYFLNLLNTRLYRGTTTIINAMIANARIALLLIAVAVRNIIVIINRIAPKSNNFTFLSMLSFLLQK